MTETPDPRNVDSRTDSEREADENARASRADLITFLRSTTTTRIDREADGDTEVRTEHVARFAVEPGALPDMTHKYGSQTFRPRWLTVLWVEGQLSGIKVSGPRVLKSGKLADKGDINRNVNTRDYEWDAYDLAHPDRGVPVPETLMLRITDYGYTFTTGTSETR